MDLATNILPNKYGMLPTVTREQSKLWHNHRLQRVTVTFYGFFKRLESTTDTNCPDKQSAVVTLDAAVTLRCTNSLMVKYRFQKFLDNSTV